MPRDASTVTEAGGPDIMLAGGDLYVAPHPDALLLFMNPDVETAIRANRPVHIVFLTSGEGDGGLVSAQAMELNVLQAVADMVRASPPAGCVSRSYAGKEVRECAFPSAPLVRVSFLRLPDNLRVAALWARDSGPPLFQAPTFSLTTVDGVSGYTKGQLLDVLAAMIAADQPRRIGAPDGAVTYGDDHLDSVATGDLVLAAAQRQPEAHPLEAYRGYNIYQDWGDPTPLLEDRNLSEAQAVDKRRLVEIVDGKLTDIVLVEWCWRQYAIAEAAGGTGQLMVGGDGCLAPDARDPDGGAEGSTVGVASCATSTATWTVRPDHQLEGPPGACLTIAPDGKLRLLTCVGANEQRWTLMEDGQLRTLDSTCLTRATDGASLLLSICGSDQTTARFSVPASQAWILQAAPAAPARAP